MRTLDPIVQLLNQYHQRATYGAVAGLIGGAPRAVMQGRKRNWVNSWVVNQDTGLPTEYPIPMIHPAIEERDETLATPEELDAWLDDPG